MKSIKLVGLLTIIALATFLFVNNSTSKSSNDGINVVLDAESSSNSDSTHVCNSQCKPGECHFKHGEKGHKCSAECMNVKSKSSSHRPDKTINC